MTAPMHQLVLTGASGGLGRAIVFALAPQCAAMVLAGRDEAKMALLKGVLSARHPHLVLASVCGDIAEASARGRIVEAAASMPGGVNLLVNNAGVGAFHEFETQPDGLIERLIAVNLLAPMQLTRALLPLLRLAPRAQVVNVGSIFGYLGYPGFAAYCASKFALRGFSQALRRELADSSVDVRYFAPRAIDTPFNAPEVTAMNRELGNREDPVSEVAEKLRRFIQSAGGERRLGFPERLYVLVNQLFPRINDRAIRGQLPVIRKHLRAAGCPEPTVNFVQKEDQA